MCTFCINYFTFSFTLSYPYLLTCWLSVFLFPLLSPNFRSFSPSFQTISSTPHFFYSQFPILLSHQTPFFSFHFLFPFSISTSFFLLYQLHFSHINLLLIPPPRHISPLTVFMIPLCNMFWGFFT